MNHPSFVVVALVAALVRPLPLGAEGLEQAAPAPPQQFTVTAISGNTVTFSWVGGAPAADGYVIEGGIHPAEVLASIPVGGQTPQITLTVPDGAFYARVHAVHGGVRSVASNEARVFVNVPAPPSPPAQFVGLAIGADVGLLWKNTFGGGAPTELVLEVTGALVGTYVVPLAERLDFGGVPAGSYTLTLRAKNDAGTSAPTPPLTLNLPGSAVQVIRNPPQAPNQARLPVRHENFNAPRLAELVQREHLAAIVGGAATEFDGILRLRDWVNAQFPVGSPNPYPPWDALSVLDWIRAGITGGFCAQYSQVFVQSLAAFGIPARYLEVGRDVNPYNHFTTEVWSNDFNKWILLDANFNAHFVKNGVPLSALEVHDALVDGQLSQVTIVRGVSVPGRAAPSEWPLGTAEFFYYMRYHLNANHVSAPDEPPFERFDDMIEWTDNRTVPWESSQLESVFEKVRLTRVQVDDRNVVEWQPNQVWITPRPTTSRDVTLDLQHSILQPSHYEWRVLDASGAAGPWQRHVASTLVWSVAPTDRILEVRGVNVKGRAGPASAVGIVVP